MSRAESKSSRLLEIEALLLASPRGLTQSEIAGRMGVHRSTIHRNLPDLRCVYEDPRGRLLIDRGAYLVNVRFNLHEALAIHLAARLLATRMERQNPHAAAALRKLGAALERLAPQISVHLQQSAALMDDPSQRQDPAYLLVLEKLTQAWAELRKTRVRRLGENGKSNQYVFSPYFIEPNAVGQSTYVIGWREPPGAIRTFKIERLAQVELLEEHYTIQEGFDPQDLLADAWGIWFTEDEPVDVVLRFSPRVARRVRETRWHRSEVVEDQPDGSLVWKARIAEPLEMLPWVRGWGADVEVLEPANLRKMVAEELREAAAHYGLGGEQ